LFADVIEVVMGVDHVGDVGGIDSNGSTGPDRLIRALLGHSKEDFRT